MSMKPIVFNSLMVQAILDGQKTQIRRIVKPQPTAQLTHESKGIWQNTQAMPGARFKPKYQVGDVLYVKEDIWHNEPFHAEHLLDYRYCATDKAPLLGDKDPHYPMCNWVKLYARSMPKSAARIFLEVTNVRVERNSNDLWEWVYDFKSL